MSELTPWHRHAAIVLPVIALISLVIDPYTFGDAGGELDVNSHAWQMIPAAMQALLLITAAYLGGIRSHRRAVQVLVAEGALFMALNIAFVLRDGATRFDSGYSGDTTVVLALAIGCAVRAITVGILARRYRIDPRTA